MIIHINILIGYTNWIIWINDSPGSNLAISPRHHDKTILPSKPVIRVLKHLDHQRVPRLRKRLANDW